MLIFEIANRLFDQWQASLLTIKDLKTENAYNNFDELFSAFKSADVSEEVAKTFLRRAAATHAPRSHIAKMVYKRSTMRNVASETEFLESWKRILELEASRAFYDHYPVSVESSLKEKSGIEKIRLPRGMTKQEYARQQRYVNEFPRIDTYALECAMSEECLTETDDILGNNDGENRFTKDS